MDLTGHTKTLLITFGPPANRSAYLRYTKAQTCGEFCAGNVSELCDAVTA
jgi:hypothetical protein